MKFLSGKHQTQAIEKRRLLKGSGRGLIEDLTPTNIKRTAQVRATAYGGENLVDQRLVHDTSHAAEGEDCESH